MSQLWTAPQKTKSKPDLAPIRRVYFDMQTQESTEVLGYVEAMLWANTMRARGEELESFDARGEIHKIPEPILAQVRADLTDFMALATATPEFAEYLREYGGERFGADFALSRNGHGAGFFSRGYGFDELQRLARTYGPNTWQVFEGELETLE